MNTGNRPDDHQRFWEVAEPYLASGRLVEGTMMGHQCLRCADGHGFVATVERGTGSLVVKLPRERVTQLIDAGEGRPFAPAGKVFREWVLLTGEEEERWADLIEESIDFVEGT
jgi:hypothetical protein